MVAKGKNRGKNYEVTLPVDGTSCGSASQKTPERAHRLSQNEYSPASFFYCRLFQGFEFEGSWPPLIANAKQSKGYFP